MVYNSYLGANITFKTNFDFTHTSFEVMQASITLQHNTLHFLCLYRPPPNRWNDLADSMFTEQLPDFLDYVNNLPGFVCLVGDMNITLTIHYNHWPNRLWLLLDFITLSMSLLSLHISGSLIRALINAITSLTGLLFNLAMTCIRNLLLHTHLNHTIIALNHISASCLQTFYYIQDYWEYS